jgi:hypothetical protein
MRRFAFARRERLSFAAGFVASNSCAGVAELADALDSKSSGRKAVWVRAPPPAALRNWDRNKLIPLSEEATANGRCVWHFMLVWPRQHQNVHL